MPFSLSKGQGKVERGGGGGGTPSLNMVFNLKLGVNYEVWLEKKKERPHGISSGARHY